MSDTSQNGEKAVPLFPRGEAEWYWNMGHPHVVWPFRCKATIGTPLGSHVQCRRGRRHDGPHWGQDVWWTNDGQVQDDRRPPLSARNDRD